MRSLVEDDPDAVTEEKPNLDNVVVEKTQTFWGFLSSIVTGVFHGVGKVRSSKLLAGAGTEIMYGGKRKKAVICSLCGGHDSHSMLCPRFKG